MEEPALRLRPFLVLPLAGLVAASIARPAPKSGAFTGAWQRNEARSEDPQAKLGAKGEERNPIVEESRRARGAPGTIDWAEEAPLEVTVDSSHLEIEDDGDTLRVSYPSGRKRTLSTDGEERELDDGDGPAKVIARRKASPGGERIVITSKWPSKVSMTETWDLTQNPRRLAILTKVSARKSFAYTRTYEPTAVWTPTPSPSPTETPAPTATPGPPGSAPPPGSKAECSIRPPRGTVPAELRALAKVSGMDAEKKAVASVAPAKVSSVISSDVEVDDGCLVYPIDLRFEGKKGVQEILIDAGDGKVISSKFEEQ
jgi:hypothetical protein